MKLKTPELPRLLDATSLRALGEAALPQKCSCTVGDCAAWESVTDDRWPAPQMKQVGSLRAAGDNWDTPTPEPTFEEFHPQGTRYDSADAPIAPLYFPYNRCDAFACSTCQRVLLKYTEFGGYYIDHRVRELQPQRVVDAAAPPVD